MYVFNPKFLGNKYLDGSLAFLFLECNKFIKLNQIIFVKKIENISCIKKKLYLIK